MKTLSDCYERPLFLEGFVSAFDLYGTNSSFKHDDDDENINLQVNEFISESFSEVAESLRAAISLVRQNK
ncbi:MAG: hypothetical protein GY940_36350 [bacterium]|nr:hypothetical protein [bacterium]